MESQRKTISPYIVVLMLIIVVLFAFLPLLSSGRWDWWEPWVYAVITLLGFAVSRILAALSRPALLAERVSFMHSENDKPWDRFLVPLIGLSFGVTLLIAGLDARFGWSPSFNLPSKILLPVMILAGYVLASYALFENRFFSCLVRIQTERNHHVVSSGPYRRMRPIGYVGVIMAYLATPVFLNSLWAFVPTAFLPVLLFIRTVLEDRLLRDESEGYDDYAKRVCYRLLPGVW
jgi:protein-S-isoprenylcysteine O-methyltransferase Ste14